MKIDISTNGQFQVIKIEDDFTVIADLSELKFLIEGYIKQGKRNIAVSFSHISYIYSGALAVLISCHKALANNKNKGGLCIIEPNKEIKSMFSRLSLDKTFAIYDSLDDLPYNKEL